MCPLNLKVVEQAYDVLQHLQAIGRRIVRFAALAVAAAVHGDELVSLKGTIEKAVVDPGGFYVARQSVEQDDGWPAALGDVADGHAVRIKETVLGF